MDTEPDPIRVPGVTAPEVREHVAMLAGRIGERNVFRASALHDAAQYVRAVWRGQGHEVVDQVYEVHGVECRNLIVECPGINSPHETVVVGGHYDSVIGSPGADDNASAVAALLALGARLAATPPPLTVRLVAFVNEEPPFFATADQGSARYARAARERGESIRLMIALEMLGYYRDAPGSQRLPPLLRLLYPDRGNFIGLISNLRSGLALRRLARAFRAGCDFPLETLAIPPLVPGVAWSDHHAFWCEGYRAVMLTDTAFYRNPFYHTAADTPDTLDYDALARVTEGLVGALLHLRR